MTGEGFIRRRDDLPILIVSQDYELFFQTSGSIEKCLIQPCAMLGDFADKHGFRVTYFVDAGMLVAMARAVRSAPDLQPIYDQVRLHIESLARAGHEIGLHVHPHWQDAVWRDGEWNFAGTRYQLSEFSAEETEEILHDYHNALQSLCRDSMRSYRAGGFCVEPFDRVRGKLKELGITIDSSVVPGAALTDRDKGFDFSAVPDQGWWRFNDSPCIPVPTGEFIEIPATPLVLPIHHYWGRLVERVLKRRSTDALGDGVSKAIGKPEVLRRLLGYSRVSELSMDAPKADHLLARRIRRQERDVWQVMGHPKLLGRSSLERLEVFMAQRQVKRVQTVGGLGAVIRQT